MLSMSFAIEQVLDEWQPNLGSLDLFMEEVRRERAVELSFEGHRFNDLRRWLLLAQSPYTKKSLEFDRASTLDPNKDPKENRVLNIRETTILERKFTDKHYWLPLKNNDANLYLEFAQKPWLVIRANTIIIP
jgi:hypothetical protein